MEYKIDPIEMGKRLRESRGIRTQVMTAKELGITQSALHMYEKGERIPRDPVKVKLANYYNRSIEDLFYIRVA